MLCIDGKKVTLQVGGSESSVLCKGVRNSWSEQCLCMVRGGEDIMRGGIRQINTRTALLVVVCFTI